MHVDYHAIWIAPNDPDAHHDRRRRRLRATLDRRRQLVLLAQTCRSARSITSAWATRIRIRCAPDCRITTRGAARPTRWIREGIKDKNWINVVGGDGEWAVPDPIDRETRSGPICRTARIDHIQPRDAETAVRHAPYCGFRSKRFDISLRKYRFNWDSPIAFAPWDPHVGWFGGNVIFQTTRSRRALDDDQPRSHAQRQRSSAARRRPDHARRFGRGVVRHDARHRGIARDRKGEIWVGTDDGLVQLTRDGGQALEERDAAGCARVRPLRSRRAVARSSTEPRTRSRRPLLRRLRNRTYSSRTTSARRGRGSSRACPADNGCARSARISTTRTSSISAAKRGCSFRSTAARLAAVPKRHADGFDSRHSDAAANRRSSWSQRTGVRCTSWTT